MYDGDKAVLTMVQYLKEDKEKDENIYEAHTILTLDQAYNNARLLAKPDREWLNP